MDLVQPQIRRSWQTNGEEDQEANTITHTVLANWCALVFTGMLGSL